jgi:hypothetical protein
MRAVSILALSVLTVALAVPAWAGDKALKDFFGEWIGSGKAKGGAAAVQDRDSVVTIERLADGFKITWSTMRSQADMPATSVVKSTTLKFKGTGNPKVFHADGNGDPVKGAPSAWATLNGATLTIRMFAVTPDGNWTMQVYERTLTAPGAMEAQFQRIDNGAVVRKAELKLTKSP